MNPSGTPTHSSIEVVEKSIDETMTTSTTMTTVCMKSNLDSSALPLKGGISQEDNSMGTHIIDSLSDQSTTISHSSSTPSLSSLCSNSSISCLGDVAWQYEPLKIGGCPLEDLEEKEKQEGEESIPSIQTVPPPTRQVSDEASFVSIDDTTSRVAVENDSRKEDSPALIQEQVDSSSSSVPPKEVSINGQAVPLSSNQATKSPEKKIVHHARSCLKPKEFSGLKRKRPSEEPTSSTRVKLLPQVCIIPIPSRDEYSVHIKNSLWNSTEEIYMNALRNSVEFAAEGWNWRNVTEDEHMLVHSDSGELIHPVHIKNVYLDSDSDE